MKRLMLALSVLATPALAAVMAPKEAHTTAVNSLPACKSGWKRDDRLPNADHRYIPIQFVFRLESPGPLHLRVLDGGGHMIGVIQPKQSISFDCFDLVTGDTI